MSYPSIGQQMISDFRQSEIAAEGADPNAPALQNSVAQNFRQSEILGEANSNDFEAQAFRLSEIRSENPLSTSVFGTNQVVTPLAVVQGSGTTAGNLLGNFGDCYFLSSLASVTIQNPSLINQIITPTGQNSAGVNTYDVTFTWNGNPLTFSNVTDQPLTYSIGNTVVATGAATTASTGTWPTIIENAYAQFVGNTSTYAGGFSVTPLELLTGQSNTQMYSSSSGAGYAAASSAGTSPVYNANSAPPASWLASGSGYGANNLQSDWNSGAEIIANTDNLSAANTPGAAGGHAYYVSNVSTNSNGQIMVTVNNPWGAGPFVTPTVTYFGSTTIPASQFFSTFSSIVVSRPSTSVNIPQPQPAAD